MIFCSRRKREKRQTFEFKVYLSNLDIAQVNYTIILGVVYDGHLT